jgi:predicted Zn-dependent protease
MTMNPAVQIVERALEVSRASDCVVMVEEISSANLRWANNTLTTNGLTVQLRCTVIAIVDGAVATVQRDGVTLESIGDLVAVAEHAARLAPRAEDATALVEGSSDATWGDATESLEIDSLAALFEPLEGSFDGVRSRDELLFGYAEQNLTTIHLGNSRGLRARSVVPTGRIELNAKSSDMERTAYWPTPSTSTTCPTYEVPPPIFQRASTGNDAGSTSTPDATTRSCRLTPLPTS